MCRIRDHDDKLEFSRVEFNEEEEEDNKKKNVWIFTINYLIGILINSQGQKKIKEKISKNLSFDGAWPSKIIRNMKMRQRFCNFLTKNTCLNLNWFFNTQQCFKISHNFQEIFYYFYIVENWVYIMVKKGFPVFIVD
jgi:hypothetical protein